VLLVQSNGISGVRLVSIAAEGIFGHVSVALLHRPDDIDIRYSLGNGEQKELVEQSFWNSVIGPRLCSIVNMSATELLAPQLMSKLIRTNSGFCAFL